MRLGASVLVLLATLTVVACGGSEEAQPLRIDERVPTTEDAPGSKPDPVETRQQTTELDEFIKFNSEGAVDPDAETTTDLFREAGFQAALLDVRFFGETHNPDLPHLFSSVIQLQSDDGVESVLDWLEAESLKPCPGTCAVQFSEFDVDGVPNARGVRRSQTAEDIERLGQEDQHPFESYTLLFSDGPFVYNLDLSGPPGSVTEEQAEEIASALHHRVEGAPPANG